MAELAMNKAYFIKVLMLGAMYFQMKVCFTIALCCG